MRVADLVEQHEAARGRGALDGVVDVEFLERVGEQGHALMDGVAGQGARDGLGIDGFDRDSWP